MTRKRDPNVEEKLTFCLKNDTNNLVDFNSSSGKSENLNLMFMLKKWRQVVSLKMTYGFKNDIRNLVSFHSS